MVAREPDFNPAVLRRAIAAAEGASSTAATAVNIASDAVTTANTASTVAGNASSTSFSAINTATTAIGVAVKAFEGSTLVNGIFTTTASAGALTISIQTPSGGTPSALDAVPVQVVFYETNSTKVTINVTSAKTLVIPSGATLGVQTNNISFRIWVMAMINNARTDFEIGVINRVNMAATTGVISRIFTLNDRFVYGNELGAAAISSTSNSVGTIYCTSIASLSRPQRILGSLIFESGLTLGTWVNPSAIILAGRGVPGPASMVNQGVYIFDNRNVQTFGGAGATILPIDNTIPQWAERSFWATVEITPSSGTNYFQVEAQACVCPPAANQQVALMVGISNSQAALISWSQTLGANIPQILNLYGHIRPPIGGLNQNNMEFGFGYTAAGDVIMNGNAAGALFGGALKSFIKVTEMIG